MPIHTGENFVPDDIPHYTGSLDAKIPSENIVCTQYDDSSKKWVAINRSEDGLLHVGIGNTEALARRVAGLKAFAAKEKNEPRVEREIHRKNLVDSLNRLCAAIEENNEYKATEPEDQERRLTEIRNALRLLHTPGGFSAGATLMLMATLTYLAVKFADGVISKLAETAVAYLEKLVGG